MAQTGIEPATIRLVAQCLNELRYRVPAMCCTLLYYLDYYLHAFNIAVFKDGVK
jgi:hypothetical protein